MARGKGRGLLLAGLAAGAYAYFKDPKNREKATIAFNDTKAKVNAFMESQNLDKNEKEEKRNNPETPRENKMVSEGAMTSVQYYNENEQGQEEEDENAKLSPNDTSREKSENTESVAPETKINTENL
ncbi:hypothetical protein [Planococcus salinus]|uniref:Uncharacterized protein n=1 Tax=Planococcus salinus TaxID=1848460 RepID=A0A3M8P4G2_9BACL|nr:hypothetical protein [Planococcus salinus]RNF38543.1 hypothetical protein EEX84_13850 [Planococcus salinus]